MSKSEAWRFQLGVCVEAWPILHRYACDTHPEAKGQRLFLNLAEMSLQLARAALAPEMLTTEDAPATSADVISFIEERLSWIGSQEHRAHHESRVEAMQETSDSGRFCEEEDRFHARSRAQGQIARFCSCVSTRIGRHDNPDFLLGSCVGQLISLIIDASEYHDHARLAIPGTIDTLVVHVQCLPGPWSGRLVEILDWMSRVERAEGLSWRQMEQIWSIVGLLSQCCMHSRPHSPATRSEDPSALPGGG